MPFSSPPVAASDSHGLSAWRPTVPIGARSCAADIRQRGHLRGECLLGGEGANNRRRIEGNSRRGKDVQRRVLRERSEGPDARTAAQELPICAEVSPHLRGLAPRAVDGLIASGVENHAYIGVGDRLWPRGPLGRLA